MITGMFTTNFSGYTDCRDETETRHPGNHAARSACDVRQQGSKAFAAGETSGSHV